MNSQNVTFPFVFPFTIVLHGTDFFLFLLSAIPFGKLPIWVAV